MKLFWENGAMFIREVQELCNPKPNFSTLATQIRTLEKDGFLKRKAYANSYQYSPAIGEEEYGQGNVVGAIKNYFNNSYLSLLSNLIKEEKISIDEVKQLIERIERGGE